MTLVQIGSMKQQLLRLTSRKINMLLTILLPDSTRALALPDETVGIHWVEGTSGGCNVR